MTDTVPGQTERRLTVEVEPLTLGDYVELVWRFKIVVVGAAIVAGVAAFAGSMLGPRVYESTVTFATTQSKIGDGGQSIANTASFRPMVESLTTAAAVVAELGLDKPPHDMRPSDLLRNYVTVAEVRGTNLITVTVTMADPALAATVANSVANHAVQTARRVSSTEASYARDMIKEQLDLAVRRLDLSDTRIREYRREAQVEAVKKDVEAQLGGPQSGGGRVSLLDLLVKIASEKARLAVMERDLAARNRINVLKKTIDSEPALADAVRQAAPGSVLGMQLSSESINDAYQGMDLAAATARSNLAALEKQRTELMDVRKLHAGTLPVLNRLYEIEGELARRQVERDLAEKIYVDLSQRYEVARLHVVGRSAEFVIIDPAVPADRPVSRQVARNAVIAAVVGFCFAVAVVLLWDTAPRMRRRLVR